MVSRSPVYTKDQIFVEEFGEKRNLTIVFKINKVLFTKRDFAILNVDILSTTPHVLFSQNKAVIKGKFKNPRVNDRYQAIGKVNFSNQYDYFIDVQSTAKLVYLRAKNDLIQYFRENVTGIGKVKAEKIVNYFGEDTLLILENDAEKIKEVPDLKLSEVIQKDIVKQLSKGKIITKLMGLLTSLNIDESYAFDIYEQFGDNSEETFKQNPFILTEIKPSLFYKADKIFKNQFLLNKDMPKLQQNVFYGERYRAAIKYYLLINLDMDGALAVKKEDLIQEFTSNRFFLKYAAIKDNSYTPDRYIVEKEVNAMIDEGLLVETYSNKEEAYLYMSNSFYAEARIIDLIKKFNQRSITITTTKENNNFINLYEARTGFKLADKQKLAVDLLINNKISILTGGPGTGKTQTLLAVKEFNEFLEKAKIVSNADIAFLAPTGKAARRMSDVLNVEAETIHRKLKLVGFGKDETPMMIPEKFVVVDESSMIDLQLFSTLLSSLNKEAHLLLVGDENQLPSVGAGLVLRDLINSGKVKTVILDTVFRQKGNTLLVDNAFKMKNGIGIVSKGGLEFNQANKNELKDSYFIETEDSSETRTRVLQSLKMMIEKYHYAMDDIMILTPQKSGTLGTKTLNKIIQEEYNPNVYKNMDFVIRKSDSTPFYVEDRIIQLENNYEQNIFNGEIGTIKEIDVTGETYVMSVKYPGHDEMIVYENNDIKQIDLAYAITVHKSQGSEAPVVIQIVDHTQNKMLNRSLIYTAYTRTKKTNILIGQINALNGGLNDVDNLKRTSLIKEKL